MFFKGGGGVFFFFFSVAVFLFPLLKHWVGGKHKQGGGVLFKQHKLRGEEESVFPFSLVTGYKDYCGGKFEWPQ